MFEADDRESLLRSLKGYLADLVESGVDELAYGAVPAKEHAAVPERAAAPEPELQCRVEGDRRARLVVVMSGAGYAGAAGGLLKKILAAMGFAPEGICLISFEPGADGGSQSRRSLVREISSVAPEVVVALGEEAAQLLLQGREPIGEMRGRFQDFQGIALMPSYHPESLLTNEALKRDVWNDMKQVMARLGQTP